MSVVRTSSLKSHSLCQNSKVAVTEIVTKVRYRAARAAKKVKRREQGRVNLTSIERNRSPDLVAFPGKFGHS